MHESAHYWTHEMHLANVKPRQADVKNIDFRDADACLWDIVDGQLHMRSNVTSVPCKGISKEDGIACENCQLVGNRKEPSVVLGKWTYRGHCINYYRFRAFGKASHAEQNLKCMHVADYVALVPEVCMDMECSLLYVLIQNRRLWF